MSTPIQIVVCRDPSDRETDVYVDTLRVAIEGSTGSTNSPSEYLDDSVDLGIRVLEPLNGITDQEIGRLLEGARHTILVKIGETRELADKLEAKISPGNSIIATPFPPNRGELQAETPHGGIESALAPVVTVLQTMQRARQVLIQDLKFSEDTDVNLKLFISHAKADGVAMARSLIGVLRQLQGTDRTTLGFDYFYDAEHIKPGEIWRDILCSEARRSVLIALRTEAYENRYWCQREFLAAETNGMPIVSVDLRKAQYHSSALLPFDVVPTVRIHDGNVIRVILHAMAAHLRTLRVCGLVSKEVKVLPHRPSVYALYGISQSKAAKEVKSVAYPGPKLPMTFCRAVEPILNQGDHRMNLIAFDEL